MLIVEPLAAQQPTQSYPPLSQFLTLSKPQLSIGSENTEGPTLFGDVRDVALDRLLNVYIIDRGNQQVREFSSSGKFLSAAGRPGRGPGDFSSPDELYHDREHTLYVADHLLGVSRFDTRDGKLVFLNRFADGWEPSDVCMLDHRLFLSAWHDGHSLHEFTPDGKYLRSFGGGWSSDTNAFVREAANLGGFRITCDSISRRIFVTVMDLRIVRAYDSKGTVLWQQNLPEFGPSTFTANPGHRATRVVRNNYTVALLRLGSDYLAATVRRMRFGSESPSQTMAHRRAGVMPLLTDREFVLYVLSASTGEVLTYAAKTPLIVDAQGDIAVAYEEEPFPRAYVVKWSEVKRSP
jgi:hypothetical protein